MNSKIFCLLLTLMLLQVAYTADCQLCTYSVNGQDDNGSCTPCDEGTCTPGVATQGTDQSVCIARKCKAGKKSSTGYDLNGRGKGCDACEDNTHSLEGSTDCNLIPCGYGSYGQTGYYDDNSDDWDECVDCPDDRTTSKENTIGNDESACDVKLMKCPAGKYSRDGNYPEGNEAVCKECKTGTYSKEGSTSCDLRPCHQGTYSETGYYDYSDKDNCKYICPEGKSTKQKNTKGTEDSVCDLELKKCPEGKYSQTGYDLDGNGQGCIDCANDTYSSEAGSKECNLVLCGYGFYSQTGYYDPKSKTKCKKCPIGKSTDQKMVKGENDSVCTLELNKCPEGQWSTTGYNGNRQGTECKKCKKGTSSEIGSKKCNIIFCGFGYYSQRGYYYDQEMNDCKKCPLDKSTKELNTQGEDDSACSLQLKLCPEGYWSDTGYDKDGEGSGCYDCDVFTYSLEGSTECNQKPCGYGFYSLTGYYVNNRESECKKCPLGKSTLNRRQLGSDDSACDVQLKLCKEGQYSSTGYDSDGQGNGCYYCDYLTHSLEGSTECNLKFCDHNSYSETGYYDSQKQIGCKACPANTFTEGMQTIGQDDSVCIKKYSKDTKGEDDSDCSLQLKLCPEGKWSDTGYDKDGEGSGCYDCDLFTYSLEGSTECNQKPCGYGFYSLTGYYVNDRESECKKCPLDKSTLNRRQLGSDDSACDVQLKLCKEGQYSSTGYDQDGQGHGCENCDYHSHSLEGSTECNLKPCDQDFYSETGYYDSQTQIGCKACPANTFTEGIQTIGQDDSVCIKKQSEGIDKSSNNEIDYDTQGSKNNISSSIIIQITLSFILLVTIF